MHTSTRSRRYPYAPTQGLFALTHVRAYQQSSSCSICAALGLEVFLSHHEVAVLTSVSVISTSRRTQH
eukprot:4279467-Pleurochrysis_carterae.AAC.1